MSEGVGTESLPSADAGRMSMRRNPAQILRVFTIGSVFGVIAIVALVLVGVYRIYYHHIVKHAEVNAVNLAAALFEQERETFTGGRSDEAQTLAVRPEALAALDARMRRYLTPLEMVKIKVFARDGTIVYSTDHSIIGKGDRENGRLARSLAGYADSSLKTKDRVWDLAGEEKYDIDLVETYVPIREGQRVIGSFETYTDVTWSRNEIRYVLAVAGIVVLLVLFAVFGILYVLMRTLTRQLSEAEHDLEQMAITDSLTGLANRRYVMARAEEECARVTRLHEKGEGKTGVGFIMADIDHFKHINDAHGHLAGDRVLREIAARIRRVTRRYDIVGRYGGEEFLVVLPQADEAETRSVAERVWQTMRESPFEVAGIAERVTISVGCVCAMPGDEDLTTALKRADEALYRAKGEGRDRIVVF